MLCILRIFVGYNFEMMDGLSEGIGYIIFVYIYVKLLMTLFVIIFQKGGSHFHASIWALLLITIFVILFLIFRPELEEPEWINFIISVFNTL